MYFLKSVEKKGKYKLVPLEFQTGIDSTKNVATAAGEGIYWKSQPLGTIFGCHYLSKVYVSGATDFSYYKTGTVFTGLDSEPDYIAYLEKVKEETAVKETVEALECEECIDESGTPGCSADKTEAKTEAKDTAATSAETPKKEEAEEKAPTLYEEINSDSGLQPPSSKKDGFFVAKDDWSLLVRNIKEHVNTMIIGPTGCGKTSVVREICKRMDKKLYTFDMGTMMDPASSLLGVHRLLKGESTFDYAKFTQVIKEPCVILLDELSRAPLSAMNVLFSCLDDRRNLNIEIALGSEEREIDVHPEVTFIATANVGSEYSGTNSMDRALVNRFFPLELGCIPTSEEVSVLVKRTNVAPKSAGIIVKIANNIRSLCNKQEVSVSLSIRETLMVAGLVSDGWDIGKAMEMVYLPLYEGTKTEGERSIIYKTIASY